MPTINQLIKRGRRRLPKRKSSPALDRCPQKRGGLRAGFHHDPEEAEFGPSEGRPGAAHQRDGSDHVHPGRRAQSPRALRRSHPRRPGQRSPRRSVSRDPRCSGYVGGSGPKAGAIQIRCQAAQVRFGARGFSHATQKRSSQARGSSRSQVRRPVGGEVHQWLDEERQEKRCRIDPLSGLRHDPSQDEAGSPKAFQAGHREREARPRSPLSARRRRPPTRCRSRSGTRGEPPWPSAGSFLSPRNEAKNQCTRSSPWSFSMPRQTAEPRSRRRKTPIRWPRRIRPLRTIAGSHEGLTERRREAAPKQEAEMAKPSLSARSPT
jgi:hypothetical protein